MKIKNILLVVVGLLFLSVFFFKIIPIPVENIEGDKDPDNYIFGGFYWTSILHQINLKNYLSVLPLFGFFIVLSGGIYLIK